LWYIRELCVTEEAVFVSLLCAGDILLEVSITEEITAAVESSTGCMDIIF
jgi:hypothetical protein